MPERLTAAHAAFFPALVDWQQREGRHGLPWQGTTDPYRVWLSEIMLQQTQVQTVLAYYPRFLARFPDVASLAAASVDDVLALWSGLGYYSRARNLHKCAQQVMTDWGGEFPRRAADLQTLSGIGRSTAAAIAAFCFGEPVSILDGNVRRVLTRVLAFEGDLAQSAQEQRLWACAQALVPAAPSPQAMSRYTQALMDVGATVCTRSRPRCLLCPAQNLCAARAQDRPEAFPVKTRKLVRRTEQWWCLVFRRSDGLYWLQQRPHRGIWAGLFAFPVFQDRDALDAQLQAMGLASVQAVVQDVVRHSLTHRELLLTPVVVPWPDGAPVPSGLGPGQWSSAVSDVGLPTPVKAWLAQQG